SFGGGVTDPRRGGKGSQSSLNSPNLQGRAAQRSEEMANPDPRGPAVRSGVSAPGRGRRSRSQERCGPSPGQVKCHAPRCRRASAAAAVV
ncbi:unnamed protein product, partial [Rangifer tarandus platyrhynchus]